MRLPQGVRRYFRLASGRRQVAADLDAEIAFHLEATTHELIAQGMTPEEAHAEALRRFGDVDRWSESIGALDDQRVSRERRAERLSAIAHDIRHAARGLARRPGLIALVALTFGLGIGATATVFGIVDRLLLRPPAHVEEPERVARIYTTVDSPRDGRTIYNDRKDYALFAALRDSARAFDYVAAYQHNRLTLGAGPDAIPVEGTLVTADFFPLLGVRPALGRLFASDDDRADAAPTVVLSHELWRSRFGGDSAVIGTTIRLQRGLYTVIGIAPRGFTGVELLRTDVWVPIHTVAPQVMGSRWTEMGGFWLPIVARLRPDGDWARASAEATRLLHGVIEAQECRNQSGASVRPCLGERPPRITLGSVIPARGPESSREAKVSLLLGAVSVVLLLIVCANIANILLVRALERRREVAVRLALGIGRSRLIAWLLMESLLLALLGGVAALLVARWAGEAIRSLLLPNVAWPTPPVDVRVLGFTMVAAVVSGMLAGLVPALSGGRTDLATALKVGDRGATGGQSVAHSVLLVCQVALSVLLLVGAGLFVRSLDNVRSLDLGVDIERALVATVDLRSAGYSPEQITGFYATALEAVRALPQVAEASTSRGQPFGWAHGGSLRIPGRDSLPRVSTGGPYMYAVTPGFFRTLGTQILRGRDFTDADRAGAQQVVIVNETMAQLYWPGEDPIGRCVRVSGPDSPCALVVGIVRNARTTQVQEEPSLLFYRPLEQYGQPPEALHVRPRGDPRVAAVEVRRQLQTLAPDLPYVNVRVLREVVDWQYQAWRLGAVMFGMIGGLALLVAAVGLYSVVAYGVARRTPELGIRAALGARGGDIVRLVVGGGVRYATIGVILGSGVALLVAPRIGSLLFDVSPREPVILVTGALTLIGVTVLACIVPAWRATRVDPAAALKAE